jgi:hypothetical protein
MRRGAYFSRNAVNRPLCKVASPAWSAAPARCQTQTRHFVSRFWKKDPAAARVKLDEKLYDKQSIHYTGSLFGVQTETLMTWLKFGSTLLVVFGILYVFFKGSMYLTQFSIATVGKMGFAGGFITASACWSLVLNMKRKYHIPPNAVYNQAIAMCMKNPKVSAFLGPYPKTGSFRAYCGTGGFKLPLLRRVRSGQYELSDLLGTKPRKLQMMFVLKNAEGKEGLVSCEVRKADGTMFGTSYYFHSLAVHLSDPTTKQKEAVVLVGSDTDIVYNGIMNF